MSGASAAAGLRRFKPYPAYKDSGVEWLGKIPAHWEITPLFTVARERDIRNAGGQEANVLSLSYGRIVRRDVSDNFGLMPESFETYQIVEPGNIVLRLTDLQNDKRSLRVGFVTERGIITSAYVTLSVDARLVPEYAAYLLHAYDVTKVFYALGAGVRQTMKFEDLKWMPLLVPGEIEQCAIAAFLDRETARIDALVAKKERLIELLQEKRTALITRAVTKGLDPNVPMKDSGVEWLSEIPAHWDVCALKRLARIRYGLGEPPAEFLDGVPFVRATNIQRGKIVEPGMLFVDPSDVPSQRDAWLRTQDILVVRSGAYTGDSAIVPENYDGSVAGYDMVVRVHAAEPRFVAWAILSRIVLEAQIELMRARAAQPHLNAEDLGNCLLVVPREDEQRSIAAFLDRETAIIDALVAKVRDAIDRLKELRTALISAAVTGKVDVREHAA